MSLTKADIDALVTNMASQNFNPTAAWDALRKALYLAAGLTATGERKPERVRLWRGKSSWTGKCVWFEQEPKPDEFLLTDLTPGYFIPDGDADAR